MKSLQSVLADGGSGVFRYEGNTHPALGRLPGPGPRHVRVVGARNKRALLEALAGTLGFPPHFGANWDALYDCLTDLNLAGKTGLVLEITDLAGFARDDPGGMKVAIDTFTDAAKFWSERKASFVVLIGGAARVAAELTPLED